VMKLVKLFAESVSVLGHLELFKPPQGLLECGSDTSGRSASWWQEGTFDSNNYIFTTHQHRLQCGHLSGKVLVPTSTHTSRLLASRFQLDLLLNTMLLIARTDSESAKLISSTVDIEDHEFIVGVAGKKGEKRKKELAQVLAEGETRGFACEEIDMLERKWYGDVEMCTFNQGVFYIVYLGP
jgi:hypothetical protein